MANYEKYGRKLKGINKVIREFKENLPVGLAVEVAYDPDEDRLYSWVQPDGHTFSLWRKGIYCMGIWYWGVHRGALREGEMPTRQTISDAVERLMMKLEQTGILSLIKKGGISNDA